MAFNIIDTTYSGTYSDYFILHATYGMETIQKGLVSVIGGIKKQHTIARLDYTNPLKPRQAVPITNNANPFTMDGRQIIPKSVDVYEEYNPRDLEENQLAEQLSATVLAREVPASLQNQLVQLVLNRAAEQYENCMWMGSTAYSTTDEDSPEYQIQWFDGFINRFVNDPLVELSTISPVTITTSNIFAIMSDLITQCTVKKKALISDPMAFQRLKFIMSPKTCSIYTEALATGATFKGNAFSTGYVAPWKGFSVERVAGMADDTILFLRAVDEPMIGNLYAGMNSMQDWELKCMRTKNADETFFILGKWKWDVQYGWPDEIFMYTTLTSADFL